MGNIISSITKNFLPPTTQKTVVSVEKKAGQHANSAWWFLSNTAWIVVVGGIVGMMPFLMEYEKECSMIEQHMQMQQMQMQAHAH